MLPIIVLGVVSKPTQHMTEDRKNEMVLVRDQIFEEFGRFKKYYAENRKTNYLGKENEFPFDLLTGRMNKTTLLKGYFSNKSFLYLDLDKSRLKEKDYKVDGIYQSFLPFISEVSMTIQYYDNQILDRKRDITTHQAVCDNLLLSKRLNDLTRKYIQAFGNDAILSFHDDVLNMVDTGQSLEKNSNLYRHFKSGSFDERIDRSVLDKVANNAINDFKAIILSEVGGLIKPHIQFLDAYLERIYLAGTYMYARMIKLFLDLNPLFRNTVEAHVISDFATRYGMMIQMLNDQRDLIYEANKNNSDHKNPKDYFSDLKVKNITLPIFLHLVLHPSSRLFDFLEQTKSKGNTSLFRQFESDLTTKGGGLDLSRAITNRICENLKSRITENENPHNKGLLDMCNVVRINNKQF